MYTAENEQPLTLLETENECLVKEIQNYLYTFYLFV